MLMAEIRMLQEEAAAAPQTLAGLSDALKALNTRLDDRRQPRPEGVRRSEAAHRRTWRRRRASAREVGRDQRPAVVDDAGAAVAAADDRVDAGAAPAVPPPAAAIPRRPIRRPQPASPTPPAATTPPPNVSPTQMWDRVYAVYTAGQYDLAARRLRVLHPLLPDLAAGRRRAALHRPLAVQRREIPRGGGRAAEGDHDYPQSDSVPAAYYKLGLSYEALKQIEQARRAFETVIKKPPRHDRSDAGQAVAGEGPGQEVRRGISPAPTARS